MLGGQYTTSLDSDRLSSVKVGPRLALDRTTPGIPPPSQPSCLVHPCAGSRVPESRNPGTHIPGHWGRTEWPTLTILYHPLPSHGLVPRAAHHVESAHPPSLLGCFSSNAQGCRVPSIKQVGDCSAGPRSVQRAGPAFLALNSVRDPRCSPASTLEHPPGWMLFRGHTKSGRHLAGDSIFAPWTPSSLCLSTMLCNNMVSSEVGGTISVRLPPLSFPFNTAGRPPLRGPASAHSKPPTGPQGLMNPPRCVQPLRPTALLTTPIHVISIGQV